MSRRMCGPGDVVVDETGALSPGPLTGLDAALHRPAADLPQPRRRPSVTIPFGFLDPIVPLQTAVDQAVAAARGHRVFLVTNAFVTDIAGLAGRINPAPSQFPSSYRLTGEQRYKGFGGTVVAVYVTTSRCGPRADGRQIRAAPRYGPTLAITVALAAAAFLALMAIVISGHAIPTRPGWGPFVGRVNQQNQSAKSLLYLAAFFVILPAGPGRGAAVGRRRRGHAQPARAGGCWPAGCGQPGRSA